MNPGQPAILIFIENGYEDMELNVPQAAAGRSRLPGGHCCAEVGATRHGETWLALLEKSCRMKQPPVPPASPLRAQLSSPYSLAWAEFCLFDTTLYAPLT